MKLLASMSSAAVLLAAVSASVQPFAKHVPCGSGGRCDRSDDGKRTRGEQSPTGDAPVHDSGTSAASVVFHEGYETDRRDGGRPVVLIAAALGVVPEIFRDAFSGVTPARGSAPTRSQVRANKDVLMRALSGHGVTNDRLDEVSNYYRYRPQAGELWTHTPAKATAMIENGVVTGFHLTNAGAGYSTPPRIEVVGHPDVKVEATLHFCRDLKTNGSIRTLKVLP